MELLEKISWITVQKRKYYAIAKLTPRFFFLDKKKLLCSLQKHPISLHVRLKENFFPEKTMTQVGLIKKGQVYSTGRAGVLLQGPYMVMEKGLYRLILFGSASNVSEADIYIVSTSDSFIHTHFPFRKIKNIKEGILVSHDFQLNKIVDGFNIIVFVGRETKLQ
ncbi:hypothetical protein, partial [Rickettsiella grylli]|uniref:hypothetical protein n=1 Tax=Rickettsiella grylli TaxID=59196 RepID=UPI001C0C91BA